MQLAYNSPISQLVQGLYAEHEPKGTRPSVRDAMDALADALRLYERVFVLIDAIDESLAVVGTQLLQVLHGLQSNLNMLVTSRNAKGTFTFFDNFQDLQLRANDADIEKFVNNRIAREPLLHNLLAGAPTLRHAIPKAVSAWAGGIFLLAKLHVDSLARQDSIRGIRNAIDSLSGDLWTVFDQLMERIGSQDSFRRSRAQQLLTWILCATRPLRLEEVRAALALDLSQTDADPEALPNMAYALSTCAGIVAVDQESQLVRFLHHTFHEYLTGRGFRFQDRNPQIYLTRVCLTYLGFSMLETGYCTSDADMDARLEAHPLLRYSSQNWDHHARGNAEAEQDVQDQILLFLGRTGNVNASIQAMFLPERKFEGYSQVRPRYAPGIWLAARFGLVTICTRLLSNGCNVNQLASDASTALIVSSKQGNADVVRLLLHHGADATRFSLDDRSALHEAATRGHISVAQMLFQEGVAVDIAAQSGRTPLHDAVSAAKEAMVEFLLQNRADPSFRTAESQWTALHTAANAGNVPVANLLLSARADCNAEASLGRTPLLIAAEHGHDAMIECLLDHGANIEACDFGGNSTIHVAAKEGKGNSMLLLHRCGAAIASQNRHGDTLLHLAASAGHIHILCLLLGS
ncbi:ankyrin repeat domain-containing protein 50 [Microdochium nivale]|nr:ankyrin repeat domain-containing protein 50 [Microdochium nivale]